MDIKEYAQMMKYLTRPKETALDVDDEDYGEGPLNTLPKTWLKTMPELEGAPDPETDIKELATGGVATPKRGLVDGPGSYSQEKPFLMKDPELAAKMRETKRAKFRATPVGERLQWIADNGKNYNNPTDFVKGYEKHFKHTLGSKEDALFHKEGKIALGSIDGLKNTGKIGSEGGDLFLFKKGFSEHEIFKASIIQNNPKVQKQFKNLFKDIANNVSQYQELGPEGIVKKLKKDGGNLLNDFDFLKAYDTSPESKRKIGGVHNGVTRRSLLDLGIPNEHIVAFQSVRAPVLSLKNILTNLKKNPEGFGQSYGISSTTAKKLTGQLDNFMKGYGEVSDIVKQIDKELGDKAFNKIFGGVNFEHTLAKQFGRDYKYLPRNYLLKGQFTTKNFNMMKREAFDLPLIRLMKQYEAGKISGDKVQSFIDDFNKKTNNYADFSFDSKKGKLAYTDNKVKYDLSRYSNPGIAKQELADNIKLTMSDDFQKGFKGSPETNKQLKLFKSGEAKTINQLLGKFEARGCGKAAGGRILFSEGSPGGTMTKCAQKGVQGFINDLKKGNYSKATMNLLKGGGNVVKNIVNPMELLKLKNLIGPAAMGFMAAYEGGVITNDVINKGTPLNEALADNWLTKSFLPYTQDYAKAKNLLETGKVPSNMKKYVQDVMTFNDALKDVRAIESNVGSRIADGTVGMIDGTSVYTQEQEDKDKANVTKKLSTLTENVITPGSAKALEMKSLQDESEATRMAKKGWSPFFGFDKLEDVRTQAPTPGIDDYMYVPEKEAPKDLRPITYQDNERTELPAAEKQYYEKKYNISPGSSLSDYSFPGSNINALEELTNRYNISQASNYPGYYGANEKFMEGGIASLNVKKK